MDRPPTSRDVARLAGVSQATVSNVLNGREGIALATRKRVLTAAEQIHYRPNLAARSMRTQRTGRLAIVMPITSYNPSRMLAGATSAAQAAGFAVEVHSLPGTAALRENRLAEIVDSGQFEGILSSASVTHLRRGSTPGRPLVMAMAEFDAEMHATGELSDAYPLTELMRTLVQRGYRRFVHLSGSLDFRSAISRRDTYLECVKHLGIESLGVIDGDWNASSGLAAARSLPEGGDPLVAVAANDMIAMGFMRGAHERGWRIPEDVLVTGWDDLDASAFLVPSLTTVSVDFEELGARSVRRLVAALRSDKTSTSDRPLHRVLWRETTGDGHPMR